MNIIRVLERSRLVLFLLPLLLASFIPPALAAPSYAPNVVKGDYWTLGDWSISCSSFCPPGGPGSPLGVSSLQIQVLNVTGYNVGLNETFTNEYGQSSSTATIVNTQSANQFLLLAGNLVKGDPISNATSAPTFNATITRFYAGANRQVNVLSIGQPQTGVAYAFYWDQVTGALLEIKESFTQPGSGTIAVDAKVTSTNLWPSTLPDFTLSSTSPSPPSINVGSSSTSTITLTSLNALSGSLQLSAFVAPSFVSRPVANVANPTITLGITGQTTLTITTTSSTTPGLYTVQVVANYTTTVSHFTTLSFTVTGPDFSISAVPASLRIPSGSTDFSTIVVRSMQGFTGNVALSFAPGSLQLSLSNTSVSLSAGGTANSTLTITVPNFLPAGFSEPFQVTGTSGPLVNQVQGSVNVTATAPPPDINITASPSSLVLAQGATGVSTITVTSMRGFTGTVNLHSSPYGDVIGNFNVNTLTLTPTATSAQAILAVTGYGAGPSKLYVSASGPLVYRSLNLTVDVNPPGPDFTINASRTFFSISPGGTASSTITLTSFNGYSDTISLVQQVPFTSCEPTISSGTNPIQLHPNGSNTTTIRFTVPSCSAQGYQNFDLTATGTKLPLDHQIVFVFNVAGTSTLPDFTLTSGTNSSIKVPQGSVGNTTVTVRSINGFSGIVTLVDNYFGGAVIRPSTVTLNPGEATNVTLTQAITVYYQTGCCFPTSLLATSGAISHTLTMRTWNVTAGLTPGFSITPSSYYVQLLESHPSFLTLSIASLNNFSGTVSLDSIFDSQHFAVSLNQTTVTISPTKPAAVKMTINNASSFSDGTRSIYVLGTSGQLSDSTGIQLDVTSLTVPDFSITLTSNILYLVGADVGRVNLQVKSLNGFTGTVTLLGTLANYFNSVWLSNNQILLSAGQTVNVTMWVTTTTFNAYTYFNFNALSGTTMRYYGEEINAIPPADFGIYPSSSALSFSVGSSTSTAINLYPIGTFNSPVSLTVFGFPAGLNLHLNATTVTPVPYPGRAAANLTITGSVPGSYLVVIMAASGLQVHSLVLLVNVNGTAIPDFSITATPSYLLIPQGGQSTAKITVKSLNGFSGKVSLNAYAFNFPQLSLSPSSVMLSAGGNANVTLTVPVPSSVGIGHYDIGVSGNSSTFFSTLTVPVNVTSPGNNFSVTANPSLLPILVGAQSTSTITVSANGGFTGTVTLTNSTSLPGPRCSPSQTSIVLTSTVTSGTSTLTCTGTAQGTYDITITGTSGSEQHSTVVTIFVPRIAYVPGVSVGQTVTFKVADLTWTSSIPKQILPEPSFLILLNDTSHIDLTVTRISGSLVTLQLTWHYNNGTLPTIGYYSIDVATGAYNSTGVVPLSFSNSLVAAGLQAPDHIYETPYSATFNMTTTKTLLGTSRTVNFLNMTMTSPNSVASIGSATDQISGILVGIAAHFSINGGSLGTAQANAAFSLNSTNIWTTSSKPSVAIISITPNPANTGQQVTVHFTISSPTAVSGITVNWGDGTTDTLQVSATSDTHTYANTGTQTHSAFVVNVTATNNAGHGSTTTMETVNDRPPTVTISNVSPNPATTGQTVTVTFSGSDPDGTVASYTVNWGDSSTLDTLSGTTTSDTHTYTSAGPYTTTVTATDNSGSTGQNTGSINVQAALAPTVTISNVGPSPANTGATVTVTFSVSSTATVTGITVNWGDGSTPDSLPGSATSDAHSYSSTASATYQSFTITVTATNSAGPGSKTATELVYDRPPTVTISNVSPNPANTGATVTVMFSGTDPDGTIATYSVNWGDGHTDPTISGTATSDMHSYSNAGSFTITVTAIDNGGSTGTNTMSMTVNGPGKTTATLAVSCFASSIVTGASTSCTVTVTGSSIYPPVGVVTLSTNSTTGSFTPSTGTCTLDTYGTCSVMYTDTATASRTALISAAYPGDLYNTAASNSFSLKVVKPSTGLTTASLTLACSASTIQVGAFTTCTATVTGSTPTGSVTLTSNSPTGYFTPSNGQCTLASGSCAVTYTDTSTASVTARIYAHYSGDGYNTGAYTNTTLTIVKPSTTTATATATVTMSSGSATADQTATTGVSVQITGSTATNGTPAAINTQDLSSPSTSVGTVSLSGAKYYDVVVTGVTSGNAKVCINYSSASSSTTMQYWSGTAWTSATGISVNGGTICGQIPVLALTGTNIAVGNPVQPVPTTPPTNSNLLIIIAGVVAAVVVIALVAVVVLRRRKTIQTQPVSR